MLRSFSFFLCLLLVLGACRFPKFEQPGAKSESVEIPANAIVFFEIDNYAVVLVNDVEVFRNESNLSPENPSIVVDLKQFIRRGENKVEIKLLDTPNNRCIVNTWAISYDLYTNGEIADYWSQQNEPDDACVEEYKVEKVHYISI